MKMPNSDKLIRCYVHSEEEYGEALEFFLAKFGFTHVAGLSNPGKYTIDKYIVDFPFSKPKVVGLESGGEVVTWSWNQTDVFPDLASLKAALGCKRIPKRPTVKQIQLNDNHLAKVSIHCIKVGCQQFSLDKAVELGKIAASFIKAKKRYEKALSRSNTKAARQNTEKSI